MPKRTHWIPHFSTGNTTLDEQHQQLLALCNALADCLDNPGLTAGSSFSGILEGLFASVREHFAMEMELLAGNDYPMLDERMHESEEFDYLASEIISTKNFDHEELQTYLALWCTGHIVEPRDNSAPIWSARQNRPTDSSLASAGGNFKFRRFFRLSTARMEDGGVIAPPPYFSSALSGPGCCSPLLAFTCCGGTGRRLRTARR